jgi:hypothetical protein
MKTCHYPPCDNVLTRQQVKFCSSKCAGDNKNLTKLQSWLTGQWDGNTQHGLSTTVRNHLLKVGGYKCSACGWDTINLATGSCPLEINHINGNWLDNSASNLEVLCPNCHALTPNYKALNKEGRSFRKNYSQFQSSAPKPVEGSKICACGEAKQLSSSSCPDCKYGMVKNSTDERYPPIPEMVASIEKLGYSAYGRILGVSDNAIRKFLHTRGVSPLPCRRPRNGVY